MNFQWSPGYPPVVLGLDFERNMISHALNPGNLFDEAFLLVNQSRSTQPGFEEDGGEFSPISMFSPAAVYTYGSSVNFKDHRTSTARRHLVRSASNY